MLAGMAGHQRYDLIHTSNLAVTGRRYGRATLHMVEAIHE
jgi:hypothetical protein